MLLHNFSHPVKRWPILLEYRGKATNIPHDENAVLINKDFLFFVFDLGI